MHACEALISAFAATREARYLERAETLARNIAQRQAALCGGGIPYGFDLDGKVCDGAKYHWVQAESMAAAAILARRTGDASYQDWYQRIWQYCWQHFVDHQQGAWFRILRPATLRYFSAQLKLAAAFTSPLPL